MTLGAEMISPINSLDRYVGSSDNATSSGGSSVVVWMEQFSPTDYDIRAQRYNSFGSKLGPEIPVSLSYFNEYAPAVAMDDLGGFVVTWTQVLPNYDTNVVAQRFDSSGNAVGGVIQVGAGTFVEGESDVATDRYGNFVVSYTRVTNNNNPDVFAKRYNGAGQLLGVIDVATSSYAEMSPSIAMTPDGLFNIAWERAYSSTDHDIYMSRYNSGGGQIGFHTISFSSANDRTPSVSMDNAGNSVVAWERGGDIKAKRVSVTGALGGDINIASAGPGEDSPTVALRRGGGGFVVAYNVRTSVVGPNYETRTRVAEVTSADVVTTIDVGVRSDPSLSIDAFGNYLLTYTSNGTTGQRGIRGRRGYLLF